MKLKKSSSVPVLLLAALTLTGCDSKSHAKRLGSTAPEKSRDASFSHGEFVHHLKLPEVPKLKVTNTMFEASCRWEFSDNQMVTLEELSGYEGETIVAAKTNEIVKTHESFDRLWRNEVVERFADGKFREAPSFDDYRFGRVNCGEGWIVFIAARYVETDGRVFKLSYSTHLGQSTNTTAARLQTELLFASWSWKKTPATNSIPAPKPVAATSERTPERSAALGSDRKI